MNRIEVCQPTDDFYNASSINATNEEYHLRSRSNINEKQIPFFFISPAVTECLPSRIQNFVDLYFFFL
jgi:hypothetical protein